MSFDTELDEILDQLDEYNDVDRSLTIDDKLAYYPELKKARAAIIELVKREVIGVERGDGNELVRKREFRAEQRRKADQ